MFKILNLFSGTGGNREEWKECEVTSVENDPEVAKIYAKRYPKDSLIIGDAHQYLLKNYKDFDFIWSSPPCPTHSRARFWGLGSGKVDPVYPDPMLYQEIIFLNHHFRGKFAIENVIPYYQPLIPAVKIGRHLIWSNFRIGNLEIKEDPFHNIKALEEYKGSQRKDKIARNATDPKIGLYVLNCARDILTKQNEKQLSIYDY